MIKTKEEIIQVVKQLPRPLVGGVCYDDDDNLNLRDSCYEMFKEVCEISSPRNILEIGTHSGSSAAVMLSLSNANLTSVDIGHTWIDMDFGYHDWHLIVPGRGLNQVVHVLKSIFGERFSFIKGDSTSWQVWDQIKDKEFDLIFIDGNHDYEYVKKDVETAIKLNIPYILMDDFNDDRDHEKTEKDKCERAKIARELNLIPIKIYRSIHNNANIGVGFFKNPNYVKK